MPSLGPPEAAGGEPAATLARDYRGFLQRFSIGSTALSFDTEAELPITHELSPAEVARRLRGADVRTARAIESVLRRYRLPQEWALARAFESLDEKRRTKRVVSEAAYFVKTLVRMGEEGMVS